MASSVELPALGVGITYSSAIEPLLEAYPGLFDVLEVEPQTTWVKTAQGYQVSQGVLERLHVLPGRKLIHSVGTPVGGTVRPELVQLELIRQTIEFFGSPWVSDHLSFNQTPEFATGFFLPPRQTQQGIQTVCRSIADLQEALPVPVAVETGVNYLQPRADELPDGAFVAQVVQTADCWLLLDLHNIFANGLNGRQPIDDYLEQLPLERVVELHLAGGMELDGFWLDAHSGAIPDPLYAVAEGLIPRLPNLRAMIFEIFPSFVPMVGLNLIARQVERLHRLWSLRQPKSVALPQNPKPIRLSGSTVDSEPPEVWERALGRLVIGRNSPDGLGQELAKDRGVKVMEGLVQEFRASMIVGVLRLTSRLLMLALGSQAFRIILADYWSKVPPQMYGALEAECFAEYLTELKLELPYLAKILEFERAVVATLTDGQSRVVRFDFEPVPLLRVLAEGVLPDGPLPSGDFEIELTPDGPSAVSGMDLEEVRQAFPFH